MQPAALSDVHGLGSRPQRQGIGDAALMQPRSCEAMAGRHHSSRAYDAVAGAVILPEMRLRAVAGVVAEMSR